MIEENRASESVGADPSLAAERSTTLLPPSQKPCQALTTYEAARDAYAALILPNGKEFAKLNLVLPNPVLPILTMTDKRNLFKTREMPEHGIYYASVGLPAFDQVKQSRIPWFAD
jgi:hypothetical protein